MRIIKTDRGYIDFDHVLAIGEPHPAEQGLYGFEIIFALRDQPLRILYYPEDLGVDSIIPAEGGRSQLRPHEEFKAAVLEAVDKKRDNYVTFWKECR